MTDSYQGTQSASEAIFGSAARGDLDDFSDRDILIVDDDIQVLRSRRCELESQGWSVASYTFRKLINLARRGALFIQHLKCEARIVCDRDGRLASIVGCFQVKESYQLDLISNSDLSSLISTRPSSNLGLMWTADVLYVAVRNFGILYLANLGIYRFALAEILSELTRLNVISDGVEESLRRLREIKSVYRLGGPEPVRLQCTIGIALSGLPSLYFPVSSQPVSHAAIVAETLSESGNLSTYVLLRRFEKCLVSSLTADQTLASTNSFVKLRYIVQDPQAYAGQISRLKPELIDALRASVSQTDAKSLRMA
jgi:hypothetical protein